MITDCLNDWMNIIISWMFFYLDQEKKARYWIRLSVVNVVVPGCVLRAILKRILYYKIQKTNLYRKTNREIILIKKNSQNTIRYSKECLLQTGDSFMSTSRDNLEQNSNSSSLAEGITIHRYKKKTPRKLWRTIKKLLFTPQHNDLQETPPASQVNTNNLADYM